MSEIIELTHLASVVWYLTLILGAGLLIYLGQKRHKIILVCLALALLIFGSGLRYQVGTDYTNYQQMYQEIGEESLESSLKRVSHGGIEPTAVAFIKLANFLMWPSESFFLAFAAVTVIFCWLAAKKYQDSALIFTLIMLFLWPLSLNTIRQAAAIALITWLLARRLNQEKWQLCDGLGILMAVGTHFSAALVAPVLVLPFLSKKCKQSKILVFMLGLIGLSLVFGWRILSILMTANFVPAKVSATFALFLKNSGSLFNFDFIIFAGLSLVIYLFLQKKRLPKNNPMLLVSLAATFYASIGFFSAYLARLSDYFWPILIVEIWLLIDCFKDNLKLKYAVVLTLMLVYFILVYLVLGNGDVFPYRIKL